MEERQKEIKLYEAMTMDSKQRNRYWYIEGLHIEKEYVPKNVNVKKTIIFYSWNMEYLLLIGFDSENGFENKEIAKFSTLDELQGKFPKLFEMKGNLIAYT